MPRMYCSHVAYSTTLNVQTLTTSRLTKRSWQSEVELNLIILDVPTFTTSRLPKDPSSQRWNYVGEKWPKNFAWNARLPRSIQESFTYCKSTTWDWQLYFPTEGRRVDDFFALKNPTASAGFEPWNLGTNGQHATSRPPKPLFVFLYFYNNTVVIKLYVTTEFFINKVLGSRIWLECRWCRFHLTI